MLNELLTFYRCIYLNEACVHAMEISWSRDVLISTLLFFKWPIFFQSYLIRKTLGFPLGLALKLKLK